MDLLVGTAWVITALGAASFLVLVGFSILLHR